MSHPTLVIAVLLLAVFSPVSLCSAAVIDQRLDRRMVDSAPEEKLSVIITLKNPVQLRKVLSGSKKQRRASLIRTLREDARPVRQLFRRSLGNKNVSAIRELWIINGLAAEVQANQIMALAEMAAVQAIALNTTLSAPSITPLDADIQPEWNIDAINARYLWERDFDGTGTVIASMDTGVDYHHQDLSESYRGGGNSWFDPHNEHATPADANGHGTATMGVMVGGNHGGSAIGVAPGARWIAVKLYNDADQTTEADILAGFQWLLDPDGDITTDDAPDVVNGSWGYEISHTGECFAGNAPGAPVQQAVLTLKEAGIGMVFAAGNAGPNPATSVSPANYPESLSVGMVNDSLVLGSASSRGPSACDGSIYPGLVAPGVGIRTSYLTSGGFEPNAYTTVSGTSVAAPHVSGAMALLLSADQQLEINELENLLLTTATDLGLPGPENDYGNGLVNLRQAYSTLFTRSFDWNLFMPAIIHRNQ